MSDPMDGIRTPPPTAERSGSRSPTTRPASIKIPITPQKGSEGTIDDHLLTPPLTGESKKTVRFALDFGSPTRRGQRFEAKNPDGEAGLAHYTELDTLRDLSNLSDSEPDDGLTSSPLSSPTDSTYSSQCYDSISTGKEEIPASAIEEIDSYRMTGPFSFQKLPPSIRKKIYSMVLVVPGLICVRQQRTSYQAEERTFLYAESRFLIPGIEYALLQMTVGGFKVPFSRFSHTNTNILLASKEIHAEARAILYAENDFEIVCPNMETSPPPDYKVALFPRGCQRLVRSLSIRVRALYPLKWLMDGGYHELKDAYRGLDTLTIIFEMESSTKGIGKVLSKKENEHWLTHVKRLHTTMSTSIFSTPTHAKNIPTWINLRVMFPGKVYDDKSEPDTHNTSLNMDWENMDPTDAAEERLRRFHLKRGLAEAFELFKKGGY